MGLFVHFKPIKMKWENLHDDSRRIIRYWVCSLQEDKAKEDIISKTRVRERLEEERQVRERYDYLTAYQKLKKRAKRRNLIRRTMVACAAACLFVTGIILFYPNKVKQSLRVVQQKSFSIKPGERKAVLTLDGGIDIPLGGKLYQLHEKNGAGIAIDSMGIVYETSDTVSSNDTVIYNTLSVPRGGEYFLVLADGTQVWMNADSRLRYPVNFIGPKREVELTGEAYFDVTANRERPFVVKTGLGDVRVYGTQFNVKCYSGDGEIATTLVEGNVAFVNDWVGETSLIPDQQLVYREGEQKVKVEKVKVRNYVSWRKNILSFENESLENIMKVLSRWYDVEVVFEDTDLKKLSFTGNLDKYSHIEKFFRVFEAGIDVRFELDGNIIKIGWK